MKCHGSERRSRWHLACWLLPLVAVVLVWLYGSGNIWPYGMLLICPLMHIFMVVAGARWISSQKRDDPCQPEAENPATGVS